MNLDLQNLALFLMVSELGKIAKAGEEFGYSSTSASQRIRQLEAEIGVSLFHRSTRVVTLTHDGEVFLEHANAFLTMWRRRESHRRAAIQQFVGAQTIRQSRLAGGFTGLSGRARLPANPTRVAATYLPAIW